MNGQRYSGISKEKNGLAVTEGLFCGLEDKFG